MASGLRDKETLEATCKRSKPYFLSRPKLVKPIIAKLRTFLNILIAKLN